MTWRVCDDSVGTDTSRKFLEVCSDRPNCDGAFNYHPVASTSYTGQFTEYQYKAAHALAKALNDTEELWFLVSTNFI